MRHAGQDADKDSIQNGSEGSVRVGSPRDAATTGAAAEVDPERQAAAAAVVAEAVALALEAAAAEAAEAVLVTAAAVTEAAGRAAAAAESARRARTFAADAAAQSVAHEAARTAASVRIRADLAAAQVQQAASLAADELAHSIADGTALDTGRMAELLAATVSAAADSAAQDTTRAANAVAHAAAAAASYVTQTVAAAEQAAESEVTATADAQRELATATAAAVALETDARAAGVAIAAREAAAALVTYEQDARTVDREANPAEQYLATLAPDAPAPVRAEETEAILAAADERDSSAEIRDRLADERERAAGLPPFLGDQHDEEHDHHTADLLVRRGAAMDRLDSRIDRAAAASDRARLSDRLPPGSPAWEVSWGAYMSEIAAELSHDLREPLNSIIASVEMLEDELRGHSDQPVAELLGLAMRAGDRMVRILDRNMTSHTAWKPSTTPKIDLSEVVRQLVLDSADLLEPVGAVVETGELPVVRADPDEMYSVLQNLLHNSVEYARPGVPAIVRISARRSVDGWRISVRDNGVGLPDNSGLDLFSLFSRGTSAVTGHGIGLATVAGIVALHGGRMGAAPVENGAEIWFELPQDEAVAEVSDRLRELDRIKDNLVATVSHELRTPLTSILGYVELLKDEDAGPLTAQQRKWADAMDRSGDRLLALVDNLLTVSTIDAGQLPSGSSPVDLRDVISAARRALQPLIDGRRLTTRFHLPAIPVIVQGEAGQLEQVVYNLMSNALKFTEDGGTVECALDIEGSQAKLTVSDNGIGIPENEQLGLFTRFFRSTTATARAIPGTGLGLSIASSIVRSHSGGISVVSAPGRGTQVMVDLPMAGPHAASRP